MSDPTLAAILILAMPTTVMSALWLVGHQRYGRPAPSRVRQSDVVIIRKR